MVLHLIGFQTLINTTDFRSANANIAKTINQMASVSNLVHKN